MISKEKLVKELDFLSIHYLRLSELMEFEGTTKERYEIEYLGKVKFINYLLLRIEKGDFDDTE